MDKSKQSRQKLLSGVAASPGIAIGRALIYCPRKPVIVANKITNSQIDEELERLEQAINATCKEFELIKKELGSSQPDSELSLLDAYILLANDPELKQRVIEYVSNNLINIEFSFNKIITEYIEAIGCIPNPTLAERANDINNIAEKILHHLTGHNELLNIKSSVPTILIAEKLSPADTASLNNSPVIGFVTEEGSLTSHTAIMAKSMQIPAIIDLKNVIKDIPQDCEIIVDGYKGKIILSPTAETIEKYRKLQKNAELFKKQELEAQLKPCQTTDNYLINLSSNIQHPNDVNQITRFNPHGVGLFRTEYLFINQATIPSEEKQFKAYKKVIEELSPKPVIVRTMDMGGDKISSIISENEDNPFLGTRGIRLSLKHPKLLKSQLKALLQASQFGNLKIMYPMVSSIDEVLKASEVMRIAKEELISEGKEWSDTVKVGIMLEVPSATVIADKFCKHVDFFSIGTNDLCQYILGVDRTNANLTHMYQQAHPALLRTIHDVIVTANKFNKEVSICGEMAGNILYTPLLIGCGLKELSMTSSCIPAIRSVIRALNYEQCKELTAEALKCDTAEEVEKICTALFQSNKKLQLIWHHYHQKNDF